MAENFYENVKNTNWLWENITVILIRRRTEKKKKTSRGPFEKFQLNSQEK